MNRNKKRSEETRDRILQAAGRLFAQYGYDASGVAAICKSAGVSKGAFYHHFESKQKLFLVLLKRWLTRMDDQLDQLRMQPTTVPETLLSMVPVVLRVLEEGHAQFPLYLEFWNRATRDPAVWEASIEPYHRYRNFFAKMIQAGIEEGTLEEIDPRSGAALVVALGVGLIIQGLLDPEGAQWEQIADESVSILLNGLMR